MKDKPAKGKTPKAPDQSAVKRPVGRPSKYNPEMCNIIKAIGLDGGSRAEMAVAIGISRETMVQWEKDNMEFSDAIKDAVQLSQSWWERQGRHATFDSKDFSATAYIFQMKNRFPNDWRDKVEQEHSGKVEGFSIQINLGD
jgi:DNA-binding XRE family transcriptional regulator